MGRDVNVTFDDRTKSSESTTATVPIDLALSPETDADIEQLAREIRGTKADVFTWAVALLSLAVDAKKRGRRLAVIDNQGRIESEITGL